MKSMSYGTISLSPFAPAPDPKCNDIEVSVSSALSCKTRSHRQRRPATTACAIALACGVNTVKGVEEIEFELRKGSNGWRE